MLGHSNPHVKIFKTNCDTKCAIIVEKEGWKQRQVAPVCQLGACTVSAKILPVNGPWFFLVDYAI
jgi:hypothetical protein